MMAGETEEEEAVPAERRDPFDEFERALSMFKMPALISKIPQSAFTITGDAKTTKTHSA